MSRKSRQIILCVACVTFGLAASSCTYYPFGNDERASTPQPTRAPAHRAEVHRSQPATVPRAPLVAMPSVQTANTQIDHLIGLNERELSTKLGSPAVRADHHPGTSWVYRDADCSLEISLYPDLRTHVNRALSYEVTSNANSDSAKSRCASKYADRVAAAQPLRR